ncbi:hypothetical protein AALB81_14145 [Lachnospiraceae bacterium 48-33]
MGTYCSYIDKADLHSEFKIKIYDNLLESVGCVFAIENESSIISLETDEYWKSAVITGEYITINENGNIESKDYTINNLSVVISLETLENIHRENIYKNISSGQDLIVEY